MKKQSFHIISHTHWDREWYLNSKYVNMWLPEFFNSIFEMMGKEPEYKYVLDGQTAIIEDLLDEVKIQGLDSDYYEKNIKKYVSQGRLCIGPYYLQPDWQLISEESAIRNFIYGKKISEHFGNRMNCGWIPDSFGQISQTAQIHKKFGIKGIFVWRGVDSDPENVSTEYSWVAPDGSNVLSVYLLSSYRNAMRLGLDPDIMRNRIEHEALKLKPFNKTSNVLLMNGYDQELNPDDLLPYIGNGKLNNDKYSVQQSTPDEYIDAIINENPILDELKGQQYNGRFTSVFPGILSSRVYIKQMNDKAERKIEKYAEPIYSMLSLFGSQYPAKNLEDAWKLILKSQPHDTICGVSIDNVYTDAENRYADADKILNPLLDSGIQSYCAMINTLTSENSYKKYVILNTAWFERDSLVYINDIENLIFKDKNGNLLESTRSNGGYLVRVKNIPAFGHTTFISELSSDEIVEAKADDDRILENDYIQAVINDNGTINIKNKQTGKVFNDILKFEDVADAGDEYTYSYIANDCPITEYITNPKITLCEKNELRTVYNIDGILMIPKYLTADRKSRCKEKRKIPLVTKVTLEKGSHVLKFKTFVKNTVKDHRLRVLFPTDIDTCYSYSKTQFDITIHPINVTEYSKVIPDHVQAAINGACETSPSTIFPQLSFAGLDDNINGAAVLNTGLREYEILPENNTIALTLFRCIGEIARGDLLTRVGDAGPLMNTPDAQCLKEMSFEYGFYMYSGNKDDSEIIKVSDDFNVPVVTVCEPDHIGILPHECSLFNVTSDNNSVGITAFKEAENKSGTIVRICNYSQVSADVNILSKIKMIDVTSVNLDESFDYSINANNDSCKFNIKAKEIITLLINFECMDYQQKTSCGVIQTQKEIYPDFSSFETEPVVIATDIVVAEKKAEQLINKHIELKKMVDNFDGSDIDKIKLELKTQAVLRETFEARLSVILIKQKYHTINGTITEQMLSDMDKEIKDISTPLNKARVARRALEYIIDYFNHCNT